MANNLSKITVSDNYLNPYDKIYGTYKDTSLFDKEVWNDVRLKGGDTLDTYVYYLQNQSKFPSLQTLSDEYGYNYMSADDKLFTLFNVFNKDKLSSEDTRTMRYKKLYDVNGKEVGKEELGEMTDYEYNEMMLKQQKAYYDYEQEMKTRQMQKDMLSDWDKFWNGVGSTVYHFVDGFVSVGTDLVQFVWNVSGTLAEGLSAIWDGEISDSELRRIWSDDSISNNEFFKGIRESVQEWESMNTDFRNVYGESTGLGDFFIGTSESIGTMLGAAVIGWATGGSSSIASVAKTAHAIQTVAFYSGSFNKRMQSAISRDVNNNSSVLQMLAVNTVRTAADAAIEKLSGELFGFTAADRFKFGTKVAGKSTNPWARFFLEGLQEGLEEVVQDSVDWLVSSFADLGNSYTNGIYADDLSISDLAMSFAAGATSAIVMGGFNKVINKVKNDNRFRKIMNDVTIDDIVATRRDEYQKKYDVLESRYNSVKSEYENNQKLYKDNPAMLEQSKAEFESVSADYELIKSALDTANEELDARVSQRKITWESMDRKDRKEFKKGLYGLINTMSELNDMTWKMDNIKSLQKDAKYFKQLLSDGYAAVTKFYGQIGQDKMAAFNNLMVQLETLSSKEGAEKLFDKGIEQFTEYNKSGKTLYATSAKGGQGFNIIQLVANTAYSDIFDLISNFDIDKKSIENLSEAVEETVEKEEKKDSTNKNITKTLTKKEKVKLAAVFDGKDNFKDADGNILPVDEENGISEIASNNLKGIAKREGVDIGITLDSKSVKGTNKAILVPVQMTENPSNDIIMNLGITEAINAMSMTMDKETKQWIVDLWSERNNGKLDKQYSFEEVVAQILCSADKSTFKYMLSRSDVTTVRWFVQLTKYFNVSKQNIKGVKDRAVTNVLNQVIKAIKPAVYDYIVQMDKLDPALERLIRDKDVKIFSDEELQNIENSRFTMAISNVVLNKKDVSSEQYKNAISIVENRIKNMATFSIDEKNELIKQVKSDYQIDRSNALTKINDYYNGIFFGKYDNKTYLKNNTPQNIMFNTWLQAKGLTLSSLFSENTDFDSLRQDFEIFTASKYSLKPTLQAPYISIVEKTTSKYVSNSTIMQRQIAKYHKMSYVSYREVFSSLLNTDNSIMLDVANLNDIFANPELYINEKTRKKIVDGYGVINVETAREYFNDYLLNKYGKKYFIVPNQNGQNVLFTYETNKYFVKENILNSKDFYDKFVKGKSGKSYPISTFINDNLIKGNFKYTKVIITNDTESYLNTKDGNIYIGSRAYDNVTDKNNRALMTLIHESNHKLDLENGFNLGADINTKLPKILIDDINNHLVKSGDKELSAEAIRYFYLNTGERNAYGQEINQEQYPIISEALSDGSIKYTLPWGVTFIVKGNKVIRFNEMDMKSYEQLDKSDNDVSFKEVQDFIANKQKLNPYDVTESDYNEAKEYINKIKEARKDSGKKDFGKDGKDYGLPLDVLKSMLLNEYDGRKDVMYRAATKIIQVYESHIEKSNRSINRKKKGETYTYGQLTASKAKGTLAEYYMNKGRYSNIRGLFSESMKRFLYETKLDDLSNFDEDFVKYIRKSQPTQNGIFDYFRNNYSTMNKYTFDAIKNAFFKDSFVSSPKELSAIISLSSKLYALGKSILESENVDLIEMFEKKHISNEITNQARYNHLIEYIKQLAIQKDENFEKNYDEFTSKYSTGIDEGQLALNLMRIKNKNVSNIFGKIVIAGEQAEGVHGWKSRSEYNRYLKSLDDTVDGKKGDDKEMQLADAIAAEVNELDEYGYNELQQEAIRAYQEEVLPYDKELIELNEKLQERIDNSENKTFESRKAQDELNKAIKSKLEAFEDSIFKLDEDALIDYLSKLYTTVRFANEKKVSEFELLLRANAKSNVNASRSYQILSQYVRRTKQLSYLNKNTIKFMSDDVKKYLVPNSQGYYSFNLGKVSKEHLSGETINRLRLELKQGLSVAKTMSQAGYQLERNLEKYTKETEKTKRQKELIKTLREQRDTAIEKLADTKEKVKELNKDLKHTKAKVNEKGEVQYETTIKNVNLSVTSDVPMPSRLYDALNIHFKDEALTKIKYAQDPTQKHMVVTVDEFIKNSAEIFAGITTDEAVEIVNYFINSGLSISMDLDNDNLTKLAGIKNLVLMTLLSYDNDGLISLSDDIKDSIWKIWETSGMMAGREMALRKGILNKLHPSRILFNEFKKLWGLEVDDDDVKQMMNFASIGKFEEVDKYLNKYAEKLKKKMKDEKEENHRRWVANQITGFMKAMMLSSPRTWVRNQTSNAILTLTDHITKPFGNGAVSLFKGVRNTLNKFMPKVGKAIEGYREGQINLSQDYNTAKENKLKELRKEGKFDEAEKLSKEIVNDKDDAKEFAKMFIKSPVFALIGDNLSRYNYQERLSENQKNATEKHSDTEAIIKLMAENTRAKIAQEMTWDPKIMKPLSKLGSKVGLNTPDGLISFVWKMNSDGFWIQRRAEQYLKNLIIQYDLTSDLSQFISNKGTSSSSLMGLALTNEKFASAVSDALSYASYEYMHRVNFWSNARSYLRREYPNLAVGMDLFMPFMSGAWNWFLDSMKRNPVGLAVSLVRYANLDKVIKKNERKLDRYQRNVSRDRPSYDPKFTEYTIRHDIGKGVWGTICYLIGAGLAAAGFIKKDEDDKYRLDFGTFSLDISYVFGTEPFMMGAATVTSIGDKDTFLNVLDSAMDTTMEDFFLTNWINTIKYGDNLTDIALDKIMALVTSFYPNALKALNRVINNGKIKYDKGILGDIQYATYTMIPYFPMKWWPKKIDPYTGEVEVAYSNNWFVNLLNESGILAGIKIKTSMPGNLEKRLDDLTYTDENGKEVNAKIGQLTGDYEDVGKLNKQILNTYYGQFNDKYITDFLNNKVAYDVIDEKTNKKVTRKYSQMTEKQRINVVNRIKSQNSKYAKIATWVQDGHKYYATKDERTELAKLGITKNIYLETGKQKGFIK